MQLPEVHKPYKLRQLCFPGILKSGENYKQILKVCKLVLPHQNQGAILTISEGYLPSELWRFPSSPESSWNHRCHWPSLPTSSRGPGQGAWGIGVAGHPVEPGAVNLPLLLLGSKEELQSKVTVIYFLLHDGRDVGSVGSPWALTRGPWC